MYNNYITKHVVTLYSLFMYNRKIENGSEGIDYTYTFCMHSFQYGIYFI